MFRLFRSKMLHTLLAIASSFITIYSSVHFFFVCAGTLASDSVTTPLDPAFSETCAVSLLSTTMPGELVAAVAPPTP